MTNTRVRLAPLVVVVTLCVGSAGAARAEGFISPLIGFNFGGDANCLQVTGCTDKRVNYGISLGTMGSVFGFEEEFAYAKDFFGEAPTLNSSVLTVMSNLMLVPKIGPIRPYATVGLGLIKTHVELTPTSLLTSDNNNFGWNIGGGVFILAGHVGVRGDIRYFHSFQDLSLPGFSAFTINNSKLDYGRASGAFVLAF